MNRRINLVSGFGDMLSEHYSMLSPPGRANALDLNNVPARNDCSGRVRDIFGFVEPLDHFTDRQLFRLSMESHGRRAGRMVYPYPVPRLDLIGGHQIGHRMNN